MTAAILKQHYPFQARGRIAFGLRPDLLNLAGQPKVLLGSPDNSLGRVRGPKGLLTTTVPAGVSYLVEQLPHCDLLRLSPFDRRICLVS
jgi:hypothetical protein